MSVKLRLNGKEVTQEELDAYYADKGNDDWLEGNMAQPTGTYTEHKPLISDGAGVMPRQVKETRAMIRRHNIPGAAVFDNGQVRFTSRRGRKEFLHRRGLHDNDGGYSD